MISHIQSRRHRNHKLRRIIDQHGWHTASQIINIMDREHKTFRQLMRMRRKTLMKLPGLGRGLAKIIKKPTSL